MEHIEVLWIGVVGLSEEEMVIPIHKVAEYTNLGRKGIRCD